jgi:ribose transport system substrate-binding protein
MLCVLLFGLEVSMRSPMAFRAVSSVLVVLGLTSSTFAAHTSAATTQHAKVYNIYLSNNYLGNDWRVQMEHEAQVLTQVGEDAGRVNLHIVNVDNTVQAQIASLNNIIQTHPDAILIDAGSNDALNSTIAKGCAQGIVMMSFDQVVTAPCAWKFDSGQNFQQPWGAEWMAAALHNKGNILIDRGLPGAPLSVGQLGVDQQIFAKIPGIKIVGYFASLYAVGPEQSGVAALLTAHPHIDGIIATYGVGAIAALKAAGDKAVPMTAANFNETMLACLSNNIPCMIGVNPTWLSGLAMKYAVEVLDGKIGKTAQFVHYLIPPYCNIVCSIPGVKTKLVQIKAGTPGAPGVNAYPSMAGTLTLPVSPSWANVTPQEASTGTK